MRFSFLILFFVSRLAWAFPDMVRNGYIHCNSCHTNMAGGGLLTEYGRALSRELLSQQTLAGIAPTERDEKFASGLLKTPDWLLLGGDVRLLQFFSESKAASRARFLIMQVDLDASAQISDRWRIFGSIGRVEPRMTDPTAKDYISSPRHGVEVLLSGLDDTQRVTLRAGRFMPAYGIGFAEHTFVTRRLLDFQPGQERYASELAWANERSSAIATWIFARTEGNGNRQEKGGTAQLATAIGERSKVGVNYYQTERHDATTASSTRRIWGGFAHMGFTKSTYGLLEVDRPQSALGKWGLVETFKLGHELFQGLQLVGVQEFANLNVSESNPKYEAYSIGTEWFPRPHWDLYALYRQERDTALGNDFQSVIWLIGHFYL